MAVNVVFNPETQTYVRAGSSDDTGNTIKPDTFGKTAREVKAERVRRTRQIQEQPEIISKVVMDGKETTLRSSPAFAKKLKVAIDDENLRVKKQFEDQQKSKINSQIPDYLRRKPETKTTISKDMLPPKQAIKETKEVVDTSFIRPPPKYVTESFISRKGDTPQFFDYTQEEIEAQKKRSDKIIYESKNPIISGVKEGAKTLAVGAGIAGGAVVLTAAIPATATAVSVAGVGAGAYYTYDISKSILSGEVQESRKKQAQLATELIGFSGLGKIVPRFKTKLDTRKINVRSRRTISDISDANIKWESQQLRTTKPQTTIVDPAKKQITYELIVEKPKGLQKEVIVKTPQAVKFKTELQTQLKPKQVIEKQKLKSIDEATIDTPIQTFIRQSKGQELVLQAKTPQGIKQIYREPRGSFVLLERTKTGVFESRPTIKESQQLRDLFGYKRQNIDIRQYKLGQFKDSKIATPEQIESIPFFKRGLFGNKKAQLRTEPLNLLKSDRTLFKGARVFQRTPISKTRSKLKPTLKVASTSSLRFGFVQRLKLRTELSQSQRLKIDQSPKQRPKVAQQPKIAQIPRLKISQRPAQLQRPKVAQTQISEPRSKTIPVLIRSPSKKTTPRTFKRPVGKSKPKKIKFDETIPIKRGKQVEKQAYNVFVRENKRWRKIEGNVPKNKAYNTGASYTDNNPTTSFKLVQKGKTTQADETKTFINYKFSRNDNIYNEKKKYQKDRIGERGKNEFF